MNKTIDIRALHKKRPQRTKKTDVSAVWAFLNTDFKIFGKQISEKQKEAFYHELHILLAAGMDIRTSLEIIVLDQNKKKSREIFECILNKITSGFTLSAAMIAAGVFTPYEYFSIQVGEETGKLFTVLNELASFYKKKIAQRRQIISALTYPALVLVVATTAVSFMISFVVPMFSDVLKRFGGDLPFVTKIVLKSSVIFRQSAKLLFLILPALAFAIYTQRNRTWFRRYSSSVLLHTPVVGKLVQKIYLSRFANTMALLITSKIPIVHSIEMVRKMIRFYPIESSLGQVENDIIAGGSLHRSLGNHSIYPKKMTALLKVGEEVNQLGLFFYKISEQYAEEVEYQTTLLGKFLEPLIIVVLGFIVGIILIAMYLPLFKLGQTI